MPIAVTCTGCRTRFTVGDQFAGKEGPCPKCKVSIKIPAANEQVVIHAPTTSGPVDSKGRSVLKPIFREETKLSSVQIAIIVGGIALSLIGALVARFMVPDKANFPMPMLILGLIAIAPPLTYAGYSFLRDQELEPFRGTALYARTGIAAACFALLWVLFPLGEYANLSEPSLAVSAISIVVMTILGGGIALVAFDFDYLMGTVLFSLYLLACLILRVIAGLDFIPYLSTTAEKATALFF